MTERTRAEIDWANNPHEFRVEATREGFVVVNQLGEEVEPVYYTSAAAAEEAICEMICDDEADRRLNRNRHEQQPDEPLAGQRYGASYGANSAGRT